MVFQSNLSGERRNADGRIMSVEISFEDRRKGERRKLGDGNNFSNLYYSLGCSTNDLVEISDEIHKLNQTINDTD